MSIHLHARPVAPAAVQPPTDFDYGFNFRTSEGYVTDLPNEVFVTHTGFTYPHAAWQSLDGRSAGWVNPIADSRNRSTGIDRRLAGIVFAANTAAEATFRVDIPGASAGNPVDVIFTVSSGDNGSNGNNSYCSVRQVDGTPLFTIADGVPSNAGSWVAANGVVYATSAWVTGADNGTHDVQVSTADDIILSLTDPANTAADATMFTHLRVRSV